MPHSDPIRRFTALVGSPEPVRGHLDEGALLIAAAFDASVSIEREMARLDELASGFTGADAESLAVGLFGSGRFTGNATAYYEPENSMLPTVLDRGLGIPISLSLVFIEVGRRVGLEIEGVSMPTHFLTRVGDEFFDPFHAGVRLDADGCARLFRRLAGDRAELPDGALEPTPARQILQRMCWNLRSIVEGRGDAAGQRAIFGLLAAFPDAPVQVLVRQATILAERAQFDEAAALAERALARANGPAAERIERMAAAWRASLN